MSREYVSDTEARRLRQGEAKRLRLNRYRREDLTSPHQPKRVHQRIGTAASVAFILAKLLRENPADRIDVSRRVLIHALALARAVDEACNPETRP